MSGPHLHSILQAVKIAAEKGKHRLLTNLFSSIREAWSVAQHSTYMWGEGDAVMHRSAARIVIEFHSSRSCGDTHSSPTSRLSPPHQRTQAVAIIAASKHSMSPNHIKCVDAAVENLDLRNLDRWLDDTPKVTHTIGQICRHAHRSLALG